MTAFANLVDAPRWVDWRVEMRGNPPKPTKVPCQTNGSMAKTTDPRTWSTRAEVERAVPRITNGSDGGIGIVLGDLGHNLHLAGIDLDTCIALDGTVASWAAAILDATRTYGETSPSGTGIKLFFYIASEDVRPFLDRIDVEPTGWGCRRSAPGADGRDHGPAVEVYAAVRFFVVTERQWPGTPDALALLDRTQLDRLALLIPARSRGGGDKSRSAIAFRKGAELRRAGKTFEEMCEALRADPETAEWVREKGEANGGRELRRIWEKAAKADVIDEMNKTFAVIRVMNRVAILNEYRDEKGLPTFSLLSPESFKLLLANRTTEIIVKDKPKNVPLAAHWIGHSRRRQHTGVVFAPNGAPPGYFNLWSGFSIKPSESGSCDLFKTHLFDNVCQGLPELYDWVFGWFADIVQHPAEKCGTALALRGAMGVGKTIVGETFGRLLGLHYVQTADPRYVTGRFNAHLVRCLLFHCDEAFWAGEKTAEGKIKDLVTGKQHPIELKGYEVFFVANHVRLFINGNPDWLVPAGIDERRFATLDVAETHKQDIPYFRKIVKQLDNGGYERLMHELLTVDLMQIDLRTIPKTEALLEQKIASLSPERAWWLDILERGQLPKADLFIPERCPASALYDDYVQHAQNAGVRRKQIETQIAIFLRKAAPKLRSNVETISVNEAKRGTVYRFPPLAECRKAFAEALQQTMEWEEPADWISN
jgi:hypothetical protein